MKELVVTLLMKELIVGRVVIDEQQFSTSEPSATPTPRRRAQSRLLESECYVAANGKILMTIAPGADKTIFPHAVRFSQAIGVCVRKTFPVCCLKWADVDREYIEVVKADLQSFFVLDFNDQAMNRFVKHQILHIFKEFRGDCHRHFKKYSDPVEACANPPHLLVAEDAHVKSNARTLISAYTRGYLATLWERDMQDGVG
ncbi:CACTA en-spm transposon protein [Cucumis melo var. makuwa]|uniref:CACTA en-spm transposon protein n=1 Tax=Cucumis melo var. makuwa TaxID=1194695 RepID=A0A5D3BT80_CUCMM|nr:CACTA en-spm transposon protein [Cucumis melo var. makuwa]